MWCRLCMLFYPPHPNSSNSEALWDPNADTWRYRCPFNSLLNSGKLFPGFVLVLNMRGTKIYFSCFNLFNLSFFDFCWTQGIKSFNPGHILAFKLSSYRHTQDESLHFPLQPLASVHQPVTFTFSHQTGWHSPPALTANLCWWDLLGWLHGKNDSMYIKQSLSREKTRGAECLDVNLT